MSFAPEGLFFIFVPIALFIGAAFGAFLSKKAWAITLAALLLLLTAFMLFFFRDPVRELPARNAIVSAGDGKVINIETFDDGKTEITVFLSILNVHAVRSPVMGTVKSCTFVPGKFFSAFKEEAGIHNQRIEVVLESEYGDILLKLISGAIARRIVVHLEDGDGIIPGERVGFIRFGSRYQITLPEGFVAGVDVGDAVFGGITPLGTINVSEVDLSIEAVSTAGDSL
jgi:phosphatidylserine decarboxylase